MFTMDIEIIPQPCCYCQVDLCHPYVTQIPMQHIVPIFEASLEGLHLVMTNAQNFKEGDST